MFGPREGPDCKTSFLGTYVQMKVSLEDWNARSSTVVMAPVNLDGLPWPPRELRKLSQAHSRQIRGTEPRVGKHSDQSLQTPPRELETTVSEDR